MNKSMLETQRLEGTLATPKCTRPCSKGGVLECTCMQHVKTIEDTIQELTKVMRNNDAM